MKTNKLKTFDCVEMKHQAQEALQREYDSRREEFATLPDFLNAKVRESERSAVIWARFSGGENATKRG